MKKTILTLGLLFILAPLHAAGHINFWQKLFTEPVETIYFIMKDGAPFRYSNQDERLIYMNIEDLERVLKNSEKEYKIENVAVIIHNHFIHDEFSDSDWEQYRDLKKHGFDGLFLMYCYRTNKTYLID